MQRKLLHKYKQVQVKTISQFNDNYPASLDVLWRIEKVGEIPHQPPQLPFFKPDRKQAEYPLMFFQVTSGNRTRQPLLLTDIRRGSEFSMKNKITHK
jgi:hypothetical protein